MSEDNRPREEQDNAQEQMTIYDYEEKYVKRQNALGASIILRLVAAAIGAFFVWCLFEICVKIHEFNDIAGYVAIGIAAILFIIFYIVPIVRIFTSGYFITNVNSKSAGAAKRHNRKLRREIAEKMIDFHSKVSGAGWYDSQLIDNLEVALKGHDDGAIMENLTMLYNKSVKEAAHGIILKCAMRSALYSAISQTSQADTAIVALINLQMIKDIVFLYGFRPSDAKLVKIFGAVVRNSLIAYGLGNLNIGSGIAKTMGDAVKGIPFLGSAISVLVDSSVQGLANGTLTAVLGFQTIRYLNTEYKLQSILDGIEIAQTDEELATACNEIESELRRNPRRQTA